MSSLELYAFAVLGGLFAFIGLIFYLTRSFRSWGVDQAERDTLEKEVKGIQDAKDIHDRIDTDPAYRNRVRDLFR